MGEPTRPRHASRAADAGAVLVLALVWAAAGRLIGPAGEFPLNDDWAYAGTARDLLAHGTLDVRPWTPAVTATHALWGALFCLPGGFSFAALRASVSVLGLLGVIATYGLLREAGAGVALAAIGAAAVEANPIYLELSRTFMTDVSFYAWFALSLWAFARALRTGDPAAAAIGAGAALVASLNRQIGLVLPAAYLGAALATGPRPARDLLRRAAPLALCGVALIAWELWSRATRPPAPNLKLAELAAWTARGVAPVALDALRWAGTILLYVGLFGLPTFVALSGERARSAAAPGVRRRAFAALAAAAVVATALEGLGRPMPLLGNVLLRTGLGPASLRDAEVLHVAVLPELPAAARWLLTASAALGAALAVGALAARPGASPARPPDARIRFLALVVALYCAPLLLAPFFDRYLLPLVPAAMGVAVLRALRAPPGPDARGAPRARVVATRAAAVLVLGAALALSVAGTHDYLAWNRARWEGLTRLDRERGADPREIDGGFEYNASALYDPAYARRPGKSWWWVEDDRFVAAFGPLPGYGTLYAVPYPRWLPPGGSGEVRILERRSGSAAPPP